MEIQRWVGSVLLSLPLRQKKPNLAKDVITYAYNLLILDRISPRNEIPAGKLYAVVINWKRLACVRKNRLFLSRLNLNFSLSVELGFLVSVQQKNFGRYFFEV